MLDLVQEYINMHTNNNYDTTSLLKHDINNISNHFREPCSVTIVMQMADAKMLFNCVKINPKHRERRN